MVLALAIAAAVMLPFTSRLQRVEASPTAGYHAPFFVYVSPQARAAAERGERVVILVQPNNSGRTSDDRSVHERDAWWMNFERHAIANDLGVVLLVPAFIRPATDWQVYTHALDRDVFTTPRPELARPDLQLLAMLDAARGLLGSEGIAAEEKILLYGFSASGMFANRFAFLHPERVMAVAAGSPGGWPLAPLSAFDNVDLPWPAGLADFEALTGAPFDAPTWRALPQLLYMGALDTNDSLDFTDGWEKDTAARVDARFGVDPMARWPLAEKLYAAETPNTRFLTIAGVGHDRRVLQEYAVDFLREQLAARNNQR